MKEIGKRYLLAAMAMAALFVIPGRVSAAEENEIVVTEESDGGLGAAEDVVETEDVYGDEAEFIDSTTYLKCKEESGGIVITGYTGTATSVSIPETITHGSVQKVWKIDDYAFSDNINIQSVTIPASITTLGKGAFRGCTALTSVTINATDLGAASEYSTRYSRNSNGYVFSEDSYYHSIFYNAGVASGLKVIFGAGVKHIPNYLFATSVSKTNGEYCKISSVTISDSVTQIGIYAFYNCYNLNEIDFGKGVKTIGNYAFCNDSGIESYDLPDSLTDIGAYAFSNNTGLKQINLPSNVTSIGEHAYDRCTAVTSVILPEKVAGIGKCAFWGCTALTSATINSTDLGAASEYSASYSRSGDGYIYSGDSYYYSIFYNAGAASGLKVIFGAGVKHIPNYLFATGVSKANGDYCKVSSVTISDSVTQIGIYAFYNCYNLSDIDFGKGVKTIGNYAFCNNSGVENYNLPDSLTDIGVYTFSNNTGLKQINLPSNVTSIGEHAYDRCTAVTSVILPEKVAGIGKCAFWGCTALTSVTINSTDLVSASEYSARCSRSGDGYIYSGDSYYYSIFYNAGSMDGMSVTFSNGVKKIPAYLFATGAASDGNHCKISSVSIPPSVTEVGDYAFYNCVELKKISFLGSAPKIGGNSFGGVTATVYYPNNSATWNTETKVNYGGTLTWTGEASAIRFVEGIALNKTSVSLKPGSTEILTAIITPADASDTSVIWSSDNESVATALNGLVTAVAEGSAVITVTANDGGYTATCTVNVSQDADESDIAVTGVSLTPTTLTIGVGKTGKLSMTITPENATNTDVTWYSYDPYVATVTQAGVVTGVDEGTTMISVTTNDGGYTAEATVKVSKTASDNDNYTYAVGEKVNIASYFSSGYTTIAKYKSSSKKIATISKRGVLTAKKAGYVTITAYAKSGKSYYPIDSRSFTIEKPKFYKFSTIRRTTRYDVTDMIYGTSLAPSGWKSSKPGVMSVDQNGVITVYKSGNATLTAYFGSGSTRGKLKAKITVKIPKLNKSSLTISAGNSAKLKLSNTGGASVIWSSSDDTVAVVNNGKVYGISPGNVTITATVNGVKYSCYVTVY